MTTATVSPLLAAADAVPADGPDSGVAAHYGDPYREQRQLAAEAAAVDLSHRGVLRVSGPDRLTWLHSLTSQHLTDVAPGQSTEALVLSPHGHVEHHARLVDDGTATWLSVEPGTAPALAGYLDSMRFWSRVEVADVTANWAVVWLPPDELDGAGDGPLWRPAIPYEGLPGGERIVPRATLVDVLAGDGAAGVWAYEALRVAARVPRLGFETDHRTIPHEVGWLATAVHLDKGCYRGQETVARVHNLGRPPRRLVLLHLDGSVDTLPAHGETVIADDRPLGMVTTSARHHELGPIALALVKRSVDDGMSLTAGGVAAAIDAG